MKTRLGQRRRSRASRAGQEMVEFAMIATALLSLMFGLMFLGSVVYKYNALSAAAREAVRYAMVHSPTSANPAKNSDIQEVAINYATGVNLTMDDVVVTWPADPQIDKKNDAQVQISYPYSLTIPFLGPVTINLTSTSRMLVSQ